ncbi:DUF1212 domain protein [Aspergillus clavatus NRRL 1]|uniref:DUF1212 domain protein n=1 Tax=Aspergillus clavatus (strain ATCC 1007 / CBS 513.65 / DSM 816 / NCTC 3887 / NRRL 1 / QM 1276 / 107) TaxID=344612 RepID=A1C9E4_ASPCL|nr:DUF1212 domain protein [Aspergillus clavatus NRRL 1]EAW13468.1 DUF1212 domain protein [Aspergillus clavatus NRRL 1]
MADSRRESQTSLITYRSYPNPEQTESADSQDITERPASPTSPPGTPPGSPRSSGGQDGDGRGQPLAETFPANDITSPRTQRVRFRSAVSVDYGKRTPPSGTSDDESAIRKEEEKERDAAQREGQPHLISTPYLHGSLDITETPLHERTDTGKDLKQAEKTPVADKPVRTRAAEAVSDVGRSSKDKFRSLQQTVHDKVARLADRLGRPEPGGDDLHPAVYHPEWASGGDAPLGDLTDDKYKTHEQKKADQATSTGEAHRLVRELTQDQSGHWRKVRGKPYPQTGSEQVGQGRAAVSVRRWRRPVAADEATWEPAATATTKKGGQRSPSVASEAGTSGAATPRKEKLKWYKKQQNRSTSTLVSISGGGLSGASTPVSSEVFSAASKRRGQQQPGQRGMRLEDEIQVTVQIAEIIARQRYIMQLCKSLMSFGAPTHRLEEYMQMTARVLEVDSQFLYFPGCMVMSFDDPTTRTTEVKLVRVAQGISLGKLAHTHRIYKNVVHDVMGVEEAIQELDDIMKMKPRYNKWIVVVAYGMASATVGPFAFSARPIDMPIIFVNGCLLGIMQHVLAPRSALYSNVLEVTAAVLTSFLARAFGSIPGVVVNGSRQYLFCFSAIAQSSIALILPGFLVLCSSLELQSHQMIAGSIRMVYAIIYSLFLGYGITVGTTIYGADGRVGRVGYHVPQDRGVQEPRFPFVALMSLWLLIINQGKFKQLAGDDVHRAVRVANTVGSFTIGVLGNLYSRLWRGHAATAILPGIFVLVPSGLAATGSLITGVQSADEIRRNITKGGQTSQPGAGLATNTSVWTLGFGMVQVAIGITVGLFLAALVVYPYGKQRSGLFSF